MSDSNMHPFRHNYSS